MMRRRPVSLGLALALAGCATPSAIVADPRPLIRRVAVPEANAWAGVVTTVLMDGQVIETAQRRLGRVTIDRPIRKGEFERFCDAQSLPGIPRGRYSYGRLHMAVWLEPVDGGQTDVTVEGRCEAHFAPPRWTGLFMICPMCLLAPLVAPEMEGRTAYLATGGRWEHELQQQIETTTGAGIPAWLKD